LPREIARCFCIKDSLGNLLLCITSDNESGATDDSVVWLKESGALFRSRDEVPWQDFGPKLRAYFGKLPQFLWVCRFNGRREGP
jgi:hypothetical protein